MQAHSSPLCRLCLSLLYISILIRRCEIIESPYPAWTLSLQTRDSRINLSHSPSAAADKWSRVQQVFMKMKLFRVAEKKEKKGARRESRNSREDVLRMFLTWKSRLSLHFQSTISLVNSPSSLLFPSQCSSYGSSALLSVPAMSEANRQKSTLHKWVN